MVAARTRVKFCGLGTPEDIAHAVEAGADAIGVIVAPSSPRAVPQARLAALATSISPYVARIAVVTGPSDEEAARLRALGFTLQFSGEEVPARCEALAAGASYVKAFHLRDDATYEPADFATLTGYVHALWMFDSRVGEQLGGTGVPFVWAAVAPLARTRPIVISGGLTAANVGACIRTVRPYAVDVRSGIETEGRPDPAKMRAFVAAVRDADAA